MAKKSTKATKAPKATKATKAPAAEAAPKQSTKITPELVEHIARLALVELTSAEKEKFAKQMNGILEHFDKLAEVDVEGIEPTTHVMDIKNVVREDDPKEGLSQEEALSNAHETDNGFIKAPRIV